MKNITLFTVLAVIMSVLGAGCAKTESARALSINDIQSDPLSFTGEITINGVVTAFSQSDTTVFGVVDTEELLVCKTLNCGAFMLPSLYAGDKPLPELGDEVNITGSFVEYQNGHIFKVKNFEVRRNIMSLISS